MVFVEVLEQPWCFATLLGLVCILLIAGALVARQQRHAVMNRQPPGAWDAMAVSAPLEALIGLQERAQELHHHVAAGSPGATWLAGFVRELQRTRELAYQQLNRPGTQPEPQLRQRLDQAVADLYVAFDQHVGATLDPQLNYAAIDQRLAAVNEVVHTPRPSADRM